MITMALGVLLLLILNCFKSTNPMKMIFTMTFMSMTIFLLLSLVLSLSWLSFLLVMMFAGGILVSFMMVASLMPNEKAFNSEPTHLSVIGAFFLLPVIGQAGAHSSFTCSIKSIPLSEANMHGLTILMTCYFFSFISMLNQTKAPMRSLFCH